MVDVGLLVIDWKTRRVDFRGLSGSARDQMSKDEVLHELQENQTKRHLESYAVAVFAPDETGEVHQVALYDVDEFAAQVVE